MQYASPIRRGFKITERLHKTLETHSTKEKITAGANTDLHNPSADSVRDALSVCLLLTSDDRQQVGDDRCRTERQLRQRGLVDAGDLVGAGRGEPPIVAELQGNPDFSVTERGRKETERNERSRFVYRRL
ncbi:hypothetical protein CRG98_014055 [Punica granatum]|uniref:Uncharacterized protein n=1 Tax=Punica granatum TaxID=22663 RepID=A0A2I0KAI5_PUNGR|nr:hypothetical protein CRG98_014055 [Punica granatum]